MTCKEQIKILDDKLKQIKYNMIWIEQMLKYQLILVVT